MCAYWYLASSAGAKKIDKVPISFGFTLAVHVLVTSKFNRDFGDLNVALPRLSRVHNVFVRSPDNVENPLNEEVHESHVTHNSNDTIHIQGIRVGRIF
jgi:hypothetical protein